MAKGLLDECKLHNHAALLFPGKVRDNISIDKRAERKRCQEIFLKQPGNIQRDFYKTSKFSKGDYSSWYPNSSNVSNVLVNKYDC